VSAFSSPGDLYRAYGQRAKKRFGQHFLTDHSILSRVADGAGVAPGDHVLEIGPGCGTLTWTLMERGAHVTAVEVDHDAADFLEEALVPEGLKLVRGDFLETELGAIVGDETWKCVANLPYNVATPITMKLLEQGGAFARLALMYQKEVAERLTAEPKSSAYGSLTLAVQLLADVEYLFTLAPGAFTPPPKVKSAVVGLTPIAGTRIADDAHRAVFEDAVKGAFLLRRKTLPNALAGAGYDKTLVQDAMQEVGLDARRRPEALSFDDWVSLTGVLARTA
jgi:16S rRNA (adenine1518-N6/adenine1519-N6)-dimethyltransferase